MDEPSPARVRLGVGMIGYGFMGRAHVNAYRTIPYTFWPGGVQPQLAAICGRTESGVAAASERFGFTKHYTRWQDVVADDDVDVIDNCAWHDVHAEPCIAAARSGRPVLCEKPIALTADEAQRMCQAAAHCVNMVAFNYRFAPAVRLARELIQSGALGRMNRARFSYLQDHQADAAVPYPWEGRTSGVLLGLGTHVIDLARFLVGEVSSVSSYVRTFNRVRASMLHPGETVTVADNDAVVAVAECEGGCLLTLEAAWICKGRKNRLEVEINGTNGSIVWNLEDLNRLHVYSDRAKVAGSAGFQDILVTDASHGFHEYWWPSGHVLGWEHLHINLIQHFLAAAAGGNGVGPWGATFDDGYRAMVIAEAIERSSRSGRRADISF